ncbi:MAG: alpha/beta hydrolase [Xanthomonadales bacterium]|nr:alpha/beta hydrolase [Xanthomonadales bacterium]
MKPLFVIFITAYLCFSPFCSAKDIQASSEIKKQPFNLGETLTWDSKTLQQPRTINVYLPQNYYSSDKKYPVIYLLDGSADEDFIHIAGLVQFGSFPWINMIPESIVIGIANVDRKHDFTFPTNNEQDLKDFPTTGGSAQFIQFLEQELQPLVAKTYRTTSEKTIIGQSLGGLLTTEILFKQPDLFDNFLIVSPSMWWDDESLLKLEPKPFTTNKSFFIAVGKEGEIMEQGARKLADKLKHINSSNSRLKFQYFEQLNHGDTLHLAAYQGLAFLFAKTDH